MCPEVTCDSSISVPALLQGEGENAAAGMDRSLPGARAARRGPSCERQDRQVRLREHLRMRVSWTIACRSCGLLGRCSRTRSSVGGPKHKRRVNRLSPNSVPILPCTWNSLFRSPSHHLVGRLPARPLAYCTRTTLGDGPCPQGPVAVA